jgi:hypothetical protein
MIVLVMLSTLALLSAVASGRTRWWVAYAACTSAAVWAHYTSIFVLAAQLVWVLWAHPQGRRAAIAATVAAIVAFLPWTTGVINDLRLPDSEIMSELTPFTPHAVRLALEHWSVGYPYVTSSTELRDLPGVAALSLQALGLAIGIAALAAAAVRGRRGRLDREVVLVVALALATPLGEALVSAAGSHLLSARNLAASWPWFALALGALLVAAGPRLGIAASALVIAGFAAGALKMTQTGFHRPDFEGAAALVEREAAPEDVVIDGAVALITPGPLTGLDAALTHARPTVRAGASQRREGNFRIGDRVIPVQAVVRGAADSGRPVFVVSTDSANTGIEAFWDPLFAATPRGYRRAAKHTFPGFIPLAVLLYDRRTLPAR